MRDIRVATVQFQHAAGDKAYNVGRIRHFVTEAARARVEMIAFPEMCLTGYWHVRRSEERRVGKSVDLGGRRIIKKKKRSNKESSIVLIDKIILDRLIRKEQYEF